MRLGQLSRQTGIKSTEIVEYLFKQGISVKSGSNAKIDDEYVELIYSAFDVAQPEEPETETTDLEVTEYADPPVIESSDLPVIEEEIEIPETKIATEVDLDPHSEIAALYEGIDDEEEFSAEEIDAIKAKLEAKKQTKEQTKEQPIKPENPNLIKAPKVSLQGLKVVGKIDLPEPKVKEVIEPDQEPEGDVADTSKPVEVVQRKRNAPAQNRKPNRNRKPALNPVELQRQREEKAARERKKRELRKQKERKRKHYQKQTQEKKQAKTEVKKEQTKSVEVEVMVKPRAPKATNKKEVKGGNIISRLWRWLDAKNPSEN